MDVISICLSSIPKDRIKVGKNGKSYIDLCVDTLRQMDKFGNTKTVYVRPTKEERLSKQPKIYIGNGKSYEFDQQQQHSIGDDSAYFIPSNTTILPPNDDDDEDLPF